MPLLLLLLTLLPAPGRCKQPSLSSAELFAVVSDDSRRAGDLSRILSGYERQFLAVTGIAPGSWPPVLVVPHGSTERSEGLPSLRVDEVEGGGSRIQLDLAEGTESDRNTRRLVAESLLLREQYAGAAPAPGTRITVFPEWVLCGLGRLCDPAAKPVVIPASYLRGETPPTIAEFLAQSPPPEGSEALGDLYDAIAADLLKAGLKAQRGEATFASWIGRYDPKNQDRPVPNWPEGWPQASVERRWLLLMAGEGGARSGTVSILGSAETLARYDAILAGVKSPDHSLTQLRAERGCDYASKELAQQLGALRLQANPLGAPTIEAALALCSDLPRLSQKKVHLAEEKLSALRAEWEKRSKEIDAHLDWYEAAKVPVPSGLFDRLLRTPESRIKKGPVGRYLDAVESRGW